MYVNKERFLAIILTGMLLPITVCYSMNNAGKNEQKGVSAAERAADIKQLKEREKSMISGSEQVHLVLKLRGNNRRNMAERPVFPDVYPSPKAIGTSPEVGCFLLEFNEGGDPDNGEEDSDAVAQPGNDGSGD